MKTAKRIKSVKKANSEFKKLSAADKRVAIVKDVISQIKAKKLKAKTGAYVELGKGKDYGYPTFGSFSNSHVDGGSARDESLAFGSEQFQAVVKNIPQCTVCARGAMFIAAVGRFNKVKNDELGIESYACSLDADAFGDYERRFFSEKQAALIEVAFEKMNDRLYNYDDCQDILGEELFDQAVAFGKKYRSDSERLIAICKNIIKNNGEFVVVKKG